MTPRAERIVAQARLLGDDELAALANRGLVRRARKDLDTASPTASGETDAGLVWQWDGQAVVVAENPAASTCSCPAGGVCRHILACLIHTGRAGGEATTAGAAASAPMIPSGVEVATITDQQLETWAGKPLLRRARRELAAGLAVVCTDGVPLVGRIAEWNVECRYLPGGGLSGMLCGRHEAGPCVHRVVVVLAWQVQQGRRSIEREEAVPEASAGAVRTRPEVCAAVSSRCGDLVALGFSRLGQDHAERFRTLALATHGVDLPRLERLVRSLAQEIDGWLARDPQASDGRLLETAATCWALARALEHPTSDLVGVHRSHYERVQTLDLVGAGLEVWSTRSAYQGLTAYFWDKSNHCWCTWSEARPVTTPGFDPASRAVAPGPWTGATSPRQISAVRGSLLGAWRNRGMRLSGRSSSRWQGLQPTTLGDLPEPVTDWRQLWGRLPSLYPVGLAERHSQEEIVVLRPVTWLPALFDQQRQRLIRPVLDTGGRSMPIVVPQAAHTQVAIAVLEALPDAADRCLVARLVLQPGGASLRPISVIDREGVHSFADSVPAAPSGSPAATLPPADDEEDDRWEDGQVLPWFSPALEHCQDACLAMASGGLRAFRDWPRIAAAATEVRGQGMITLSSFVDRLVGLPGPDRGDALLLATWVLICQRQAMQVAAGMPAMDQVG